MLSREIEPNRTHNFTWQLDRFAVLLSLLRSRLPSDEFRSLLRLQCICWRLAGVPSRVGEFEWTWSERVEGELDTLFFELEAGQFSRSRLDRLKHLYRDLVLFRWGACPDELRKTCK